MLWRLARAASVALIIVSVAEGSSLEGRADQVRFGLNAYLGNLGNTEIRGSLVKSAAEDRSNYLDAVADLGVTAIRETFLNWADVEPVRGAGYDLEPFDDLVRKASERGIEIIALAYPFPDWATGAEKFEPDQLFGLMYELPKREFEQEFRNVVSTFAKRYSGQHQESIPLDVPIRKWIFSNELDAFDIAPDDYAFWLRVFWEEVKKVDPEAVVVTMGFRYFANNVKFLDDFLDSSFLQGPDFPYFDVMAFHVYPNDYDPNIYVMNANAGFIDRSLLKRDLSPDLWLMETGDRSTNERTQASDIVKYMIHGASVHRIRRVHLHGLWDIMDNHGWGVLEHAPTGKVPRRKASFTALKTFLEKTSDNRGVQFLGPGRYRVDGTEGNPVFVLWSEEPNIDTACLFPEESTLLVTNLQGETEEMPAGELDLAAEPVFVQVAR